MLSPKSLFEIAKDVAAVVGTGYLVHKVYVAVEFVVAKAQAVKTALVGTTTATATKVTPKA